MAQPAGRQAEQLHVGAVEPRPRPRQDSAASYHGGSTSERVCLQAEAAVRDGKQPRQIIRVFLKYGPRGEKVITGLERISRPGRRVYLGVQDVPSVLGGLGTSILTTSRGVMTGRAARKAGVGGEVLCNVW